MRDTAEDLRSKLESFLSDKIGKSVGIKDLTRLSGGASRETWSFVVETGDETQRMVLRRDPSGSPAAGGRTGEFELLRRAADSGVPVPNVKWVDSSGDSLGAPGFIMEHVAGETIARRILRDEEFAAARDAMAEQLGEIAARVHTIDTKDLPGMGGIVSAQEATSNSAAAALEQYRGILDSFGQPHPAFELGMRWLSKRIPAAGRTCLVHGDFRIGNFIVGPEGLRAVLDWELAHMGDPWEDLGWICVRSWRFGAPGEVGGFGKREDLYRSYEKASGIAVAEDAVKWWEIFGNLKWGIITIVQAFTHLSGRVNSVELAAIGRRTCETEYDLLRLIEAR